LVHEVEPEEATLRKIAILAVILFSGCSYTHKAVSSPMAQLRTPKGVCGQTSSTAGGVSAAVYVCLFTGSPESPDDDGTTPFIALRISSQLAPNLADWQMTVKKGSRVIYKGTPAGDLTARNLPFTVSYSTAMVKMPEPWSPGTYDVELWIKTGEMGRHAQTMAITLAN
jgi:hypothetical protein